MMLFDEIALAKLFDEWMRRYIDDPKGYEAEFQTVLEFLQEADDGMTPTYGRSCVEYLKSIADQPR